jgi:hypothetical protein
MEFKRGCSRHNKNKGYKGEVSKPGKENLTKPIKTVENPQILNTISNIKFKFGSKKISKIIKNLLKNFFFHLVEKFSYFCVTQRFITGV